MIPAFEHNFDSQNANSRSTLDEVSDIAFSQTDWSSRLPHNMQN